MFVESIPLSHWRLAADSGLLVLIWLVQLIIYPSFLHCRDDQLLTWHSVYSGRITLVVMPLMLTQVAVIGLQLGRGLQDASGGVSWTLWACALLVAVCWLSTFFLSVPLHGQIGAGQGSAQVLERLVLTNWPRTVAWTLIFLLGFFGSTARQAAVQP